MATIESLGLLDASFDLIDASDEGVSNVWERLKATNASRITALEDAAIAALEGRLDDVDRARALDAAQALTEVARSFSLAHAGRTTVEIERLLQRYAELTPSHIQRLCELVVRLRDRLDRLSTADLDSEEEPATDAQTILIVEGDRNLGEQMMLEASGQGMRAEVCSNLPAARGAVARRRPTLVVLDLALGESLDAGRTFLTELNAMVPPVPSVVLSSGTGLRERVDAAGLGARGFLDPTLPVPEIIAAVNDTLHHLRVQHSTILAVDDDPTVLAGIQEALQHTEIQVAVLDDPLHFWDVLERTSPDLLLLDMDMPHFTGLELCQAIRSDPYWRSLPVLLMRDEASLQSAEAIAVRADQRLHKPLDGPSLVDHVVHHLERRQVHKRVIDTDMLTGATSRRKATEHLNRLIRMAGRFGDQFSLASIRVDGFAYLNEMYGHPAGDAVLANLGRLLLEAFRGGDVVARWSGAEFVVGLYGMPGEAAVERIVRILGALREHTFHAMGQDFTVTCSAAISQVPDDGNDLGALYSAADATTQRIQATGGNRTLQAGWKSPSHQPEPGHVDVALVATDEALGGLLVHALRVRGYSVERIEHGAEARRVLLGNDPRVRSRLILLDSELDDGDGYDLLHDLQSTGATRQSRVMLLSNRSTESDVLRALELGAFEHVAKPFSLPILMQRVRRAVEVQA